MYSPVVNICRLCHCHVRDQTLLQQILLKKMFIGNYCIYHNLCVYACYFGTDLNARIIIHKTYRHLLQIICLWERMNSH